MTRFPQNEKKSRRLAWTCGLVAVAGFAAFAWALGDFAAPPRLADVAAAARQASGQDAAPLGAAALALWEAGGAAALAWGRWGIEFLAAGLVVFVLFLGVRRLGDRAVFVTAFVLLGVTSAAAAIHILKWRERRMDLRLALPETLLAAVPEGSGEVFVNRSARSVLALLGPPRGISPCSEDEAVSTVTDPAMWRRRLRDKRWTTVLLAGPTGEFRPLLLHLLASPDWRLAGLSNAGWVFLRGGGLPEPPLPAPDFPRAEETALYHAELAGRLADSRRLHEARKSLKWALELAPKSALVRWHAARFHALVGEWSEAAGHARFALSKGLREGAPLLARALLEKGDPEPARQAAHRALKYFPKDPETHFLLARIERARNDPASEAAALENAVAAARKARVPDTTYLAYLGQARAKLGDARRAAAAYKDALSRGNLQPEERRALEEALAVVKERSGISQLH